MMHVQVTSYQLSTAGTAVMLLSVGIITGLFVWCVWRVTRESSPQKLHGPIDIEPPDEREDRLGRK